MMTGNNSIFVLLNANQEKNEKVRLLEVDRETQKEISNSFLKNAQDLLNANSNLIKFDGHYRPSIGSNECLYIDNFKLPVKDIIKSIQTPLKQNALKHASKIPNIKAIFTKAQLDIGKNKDQTVIAFQCFQKNQYLSTMRFNLFFDKNTFIDNAKNWGIGISEKVDCIYWPFGSRLFFKSYYYANRVFKLGDYYRKATDQEISDFVNNSCLLVKNKSDFITNCKQWGRRRIAFINDNQILSRFSPQDIKKAAKDAKVKIKINLNNNKIIVPEENEKLKELLSFLAEEMYEGQFSGNTFITNSRRKI